MQEIEEKKSLAERIASKIPDPVMLFIGMYVILFVCTIFMGGMKFSLPGIDPETKQAVPVVREIKNMSSVSNIHWIFDNAIINNWLAFAKGLIGILLVAMMGIGIAEGSGLFTVLLKLAGRHVNEKLLPYVIVFAGVLSNIASDAGYVVLIPLAAAAERARERTIIATTTIETIFFIRESSLNFFVPKHIGTKFLNISRHQN